MPKLFLKHYQPLLCLIAGCGLNGLAWAGGLDDYSLGVRAGTSFTAGSPRFAQVEACAGVDLPCRWDFCSDWHLQPQMSLAGGWLQGERNGALIVSVDPCAELGWKAFPLAIEGGLSPTVISRYRFGQIDFGQNLQFTSHLGFTWRCTQHLSLGWRFQHMSNAGFARPNPGLNLEMLELNWRF